MSDTLKSINATVFWYMGLTKNDSGKYPSGKYEVVLGNLSDAASEWLSTFGCNINENDNKPEQGKYYKAKSGFPIPAYDMEGNLLDPDIKIGNGSQAVVTIKLVKGAGKNGPYKVASIERLRISDLVVYEDGGDAADVDLGEVL